MPERLIGIVEGMSFEQYAAVDALNGSALLHMRRSPLNYRWNMDNPQPSTPEQKIGTMIHTAILEPRLLSKIAVWGSLNEHFTESGNLRPRHSKLWDAFEEAHRDQPILTKSEYEEAAATVDCAWKHPVAAAYLSEPGACEVSMFWIDPYDGRYWKGRPDKVITTKNTATLIDLKKTRSCSSRRFGAQAFGFGYHIKAAIYVSGYQILTGVRPKFKWIAMESKGPFEAAVYRATPDVLTLGGDESLKLARQLAECERTQNWPPEQEVEEDLILPDYALAKDDDLSEFETEEV